MLVVIHQHNLQVHAISKYSSVYHKYFDNRLSLDHTYQLLIYFFFKFDYRLAQASMLNMFDMLIYFQTMPNISEGACSAE